MSEKITLKAARVNAGLTQDDVRKELNKHGYNLAISTISSWENNKTFPSVHQFQILCDLYRRDMNDIFIPETLT